MKKIILIPIGGLCNRIRFICSAYEFMKEWAELQVIWLKSDECNIRMEELFTLPDEIKVVNYDITKEGGVRKYIYQILRVLSAYSGRFIHQLKFVFEVKEKSQEEKATEFRKKFDKDIMFCSGCEKIQETYSCDIIKPTHEIQRMVHSVIKDFGEYSAMHIRRTDHMESIQKSPVELFKKRIELEIANGHKIYLATDDKEVKMELAEKYKPYIYTQDVSSFSRKESNAIKEAYVDLLCLANGKKVYGSYGSSFSEVASMLGHIELIIVEDSQNSF